MTNRPMLRRVWAIRYMLRDTGGVWSGELSVNFVAAERKAARDMAQSYLRAAINRRIPMHGIAPGKIAGFKIVSVTPNM